MNVYYLFSVKDKCFTELSLILKARNIATQFYGLAYAKTASLTNPILSNVSYISDLVKQNGKVDYQFLADIEQTYQVNIAEMINTDRHLLRYEKTHRVYVAQEILRQFIHDMAAHQIDIVIPEAIDDLISFFAVHFCKQKNIKLLYPINVGYENKACLSDNENAEPSCFEKKFQANLSLAGQNQLEMASIEEEIKQYVHLKRRPSYLATNGANYRLFSLQDINIFFSSIAAYFRDPHGMHYDKFPLTMPFHRLIKVIRKHQYQQLVRKVGHDIKEINLKYFIYPLHFEPEAATYIQGRWLRDQKQVISLIAKNLPADVVLFVKEHKPSIGRRPLSYYQEILSHHNVFLVDDTIDTYQFIEKSQGVMVISSTMGLEALMLGKPVISFGERFYNVSRNVYKVCNFKTIQDVIKQALSHQFDKQDAMALFYTLLNETTDLGCLSHLYYQQQDLDKLASAIDVQLQAS